MPEASMYEDNSLVPGKNKIGSAGKRFHVESVAKASSKQLTPQESLRRRVGTADGRHIAAAHFPRMNIHH